MSNDSMRHELEHVLALVEEQMRDFSAMRQKQAELTGTGSAAEGSVEVTVNAQQMVIKTEIDESYLDDHEITELGDLITEAAQAAAREMQRKLSELIGPMNQRRQEVRALTGKAVGLPGFHDVLSRLGVLTDQFAEPAVAESGEPNRFPVIRK
ncbi:YbaB/EbfC family nucleoid-associated protein [Mycolicibacterium smegmatis]|uniref:YbaB/EbfC family nucleoid-associated protein n=1 Tax=Mycolicibacterium smegmatis TaxID=1772 RepID=UPI0013036288|nr:YbaB/EbfC family nucleoid-associated protein [Mycolicibacterium smegmatis]